MTLGSSLNPRSRLFFSAHCPNLNIMWSIPSRVRQPFVRAVRCRIVPKIQWDWSSAEPMGRGKGIKPQQFLSILLQALGILFIRRQKCVEGSLGRPPSQTAKFLDQQGIQNRSLKTFLDESSGFLRIFRPSPNPQWLCR